MSTLDNLRKSAKRWLKALRANDNESRQRLRRAYPDAPAEPALRDVQYALAREHGHASWKAMTDAVESRRGQAPLSESTGGRTHAERVATFLDFACWDHHTHGQGDHRMADRAAGRLLAQHPEIARDSLYTAVVCGDLDEVVRRLDERPEAARQPGGSRGWTPLLYLCYTRFTHQPTIDNALAIARALLDRGANPNDFYMAGSARYSALVGVTGEGEQDSPRQPQGPALFQLLLERGANPFDAQVLYNTHFHGDVQWWLELVHAHTVKSGRQADWENPDWPMLDMGGYGSGARFLLWVALTHRDLPLAEWLLARGANPNAGPPRATSLSQRSLHAEALREGFTQMAELLVRHGATPDAPALEDEEAFVAACLRLDREAVRAQLEAHPEFLRSPVAMFAAARRDAADAVALLLDLGTSPDVADQKQMRSLHVAAGADAVHVAALLIERGAAVETMELNWNATPLGIALHERKARIIDLLSEVSRDPFSLAFAGKTARLRELLRDEPGLAKAVNRNGATPLMWFPDDEEQAIEVVEVLLSHGADPSIRSKSGMTAADWALKRGMLGLARKLAVEGAVQPSPVPPPELEPYESLAKDLVIAYDSGESAAMERLQAHYRRSFTWDELREAVKGRLGAVPEPHKPAGYFAVAHARLLIAREAGYDNWARLEQHIAEATGGGAAEVWRCAEKAVIGADAGTLERLLREHEQQLRRERPPAGPGGLSPEYSGADARSIVAYNHAFENWDQVVAFKAALERRDSSVARFEAAVDAVCDGDVVTLDRMIRESPDLVHARSTRRHHAMLLHYVGANGVEYFRQKPSPNAIKIAEILLAAGADVDATADMYGGGVTTLGLVVTSVHPFLAGVVDALVDLFVQHGAAIDGAAGRGSTVVSCLANGRQQAAESLVTRGARVDLEGAAGVGRLDLVKGFFNEDGSLKPTATKPQMESAFIWACEYGRTPVVEFLLQRGMDVGAIVRPHGQTGLHWAAFVGHVDTVRLLLEWKAPVDVKDESFGGTPLGWALYRWGGEPEENRDSYYEVVALLVAAGAPVNQDWLADPDRGMPLADKVRADPRMLAALGLRQP